MDKSEAVEAFVCIQIEKFINNVLKKALLARCLKGHVTKKEIINIFKELTEK